MCRWKNLIGLSAKPYRRLRQLRRYVTEVGFDVYSRFYQLPVTCTKCYCSRCISFCRIEQLLRATAYYAIRRVIGYAIARPSGFSPDSPKPISPNLEKVHSMSKCSCFVEKIVLRIFDYIFSPNFLLL